MMTDKLEFDEMSRCPVCDDRRTIRLPLRLETPVSFAAFEVSALDVAESYRDYPCPECAPKTDIDRVNTIGGMVSMDALIAADPKVIEYTRRNIANSIAHEMLKGGWIEFDKPAPGRGPEGFRRIEYTGRVGVVSRAVVKSLAQRINERQFDVADELVEAASKQIRLWGSEYSGDEGSIHKSTAVDYIRKALRNMVEAARKAA